MNKWKKALGISMIVGTVMWLNGCGKSTIDLNKYFDYSVTGYNENGSITETIAKDDIVYDNLSAFGVDDSTTDSNIEKEIQAHLYIEELGGEWDKDEKLSNGDKITFSWDEDTIDSIENQYNVKLKHSDVTVKIEGLEDITSYDAFSGLKVSYESLAPYGTVSLDSSNCEIPNLIYSAEPSTGLKNGDEITVTVDVTDDCAEKYGKIPETDSKIYTVEGLAGFVTSAADIPAETMNAMKRQAEDVKKSKFESNKSDDESLNSVTYVGNYFLTMKDDFAKKKEFSLDSTYNTYNSIYLIYEVNITNEGGTYSYYWYCSFDNICFLEDGTCSVDTSEYDIPQNGIFAGDTINLGDRYYTGFKDKDSLFNKCITQNSTQYNYENNFSIDQATNAEANTDTKKETDTEQS